MNSIIEIRHNEILPAIIIRKDFCKPGIHFVTPDDLSQQVAYMNHPEGHYIEPHVHNPVKRNVFFTREVLFIKKGKLRIDFYTEQREYLESRILYAGDTILIASGGHGLKVLEPLEMIEVKQGPYSGDTDKTRFEHNGEEKICIR